MKRLSEEKLIRGWEHCMTAPGDLVSMVDGTRYTWAYYGGQHDAHIFYRDNAGCIIAEHADNSGNRVRQMVRLSNRLKDTSVRVQTMLDFWEENQKEGE